ncbi:thyroglobulin [Lepisosteus oculatus]|uniref:thyroglobulin n=1 Tax=Lepisosteus oculatus TaxID=7918 RepID=UPI0035F50D24
MGYLGSAFISLCCFSLSLSKRSEYQLESQSLSQCELLRDEGSVQGGEFTPQCLDDGRFRNIQCRRDGLMCWCVTANGTEVPGTKRNGSTIHCLSSCELHRQQVLRSGEAVFLPQCSDSREYEPVQCDSTRSQCWCVDAEGMEIYGTRQNGQPVRCPGACEVRDRRLLHGVGDSSPPQCTASGDFLPVQCKFINTTDMTVFDLLHTFNRFPGVFQTFTGFRKMFPEISGYCFCADSRGRELANTGLELLLDEVYDTAFSGLEPGPSFTKSNMYRILQRRFLGIQLAMSGRFRCPTQCEREWMSATRAGNVHVPSCDERGHYDPVQCQAGGHCWCVDSAGKEILGTRMQGGIPDCSDGIKDCPSERRQALSRLFYGPSGYFSQHNVFTVKQADGKLRASFLRLCNPEVRELFVKSGLLLTLPELTNSSFGTVVGEIFQGIFPSREMALKALRFATNPKRLQENLFGGKFLKNIRYYNFTGAVGPSGTFNFNETFQQVGLKQFSGDFVQLAKIFSSETDSKPLYLDQKIIDSFGRNINLKDNQNLVELVGMILENEQFVTTLRDIISFLRVEDSEDFSSFFQALLQNTEPEVCERDSSVLFVPQCTKRGQYEEVQCLGSTCWCVDPQGKEIPGSRSEGLKPKCPSKCEKERQSAILVKASQSAGSELFIPKCEADGSFMPLQCSGRTCSCMDSAGMKITRTTLGQPIQCPSVCQLAGAQKFLSTVQSLLSSPTTAPQLSDVYIPQCNADGRWREVQCDGPPEQVFEFYQEWIKQNNAGEELSVLDVVNIMKGYQKLPEALASFRGFVKELYSAGHQKVFPVLSRYASFSDVPEQILEGSRNSISGSSVLLNPLTLWQLLHGNSTQYPGQYSDFSSPLGHFELRRCWCVNKNGEMIMDTKVGINEIPTCPGPCSVVNQQVARFLQEAEDIITDSNNSRIPFGFSFLQAKGLQLTERELLINPDSFESSLNFNEKLLSNSDSALRLAVHTTLQFYWRTHFSSALNQRDGFLLGYQPYRPQCDAHGQWQPSQCYFSTGQCWCVDEEGSYIPGSLTSRSIQLPQCGTLCQRSHTRAVVSNWKLSATDPSAMATTVINPSCQKNGEFTILQNGDRENGSVWCVNPLTGKPIQPAAQNKAGSPQCPGWCEMLKSQVLRRDIGTGYVPECQEEGQLFSSVQCDQSSCWCVFQNGQEAPGTRLRQVSGQTPKCDTPQCPLPFGVPGINNGAVFCKDILENGQRRQQCQLTCHQGYQNTLPESRFLCDVVTSNWLSAQPLPDACQKPQVFQAVEAHTTFQLSLAEGKNTCRAVRSPFQSSLLQHLRGRGLCSLQMNSFGKSVSVSVCDESTVTLECLSAKRMRANITWKAQLGDIPTEALPDLHDIDNAFVSRNLVKGIIDLIGSGVFWPVLDSEPFPPDVSYNFVPEVQFGCTQGYRPLLGVRGCAICPTGTFVSGAVCTPCPHGSYQDQEGSHFCKQCPQGWSTGSTGAFKATHCLTDCQNNPLGLECTEEGAYREAQRDAASEKWFCVTDRGEKLNWTVTMETLTVSQCKVMQKFEDVPKTQWILDANDAVIMSSKTSNESLESYLKTCIAECAADESCLHLAVFTEGSTAHCDLYSTSNANIKCTTSEKATGFLGNSVTDVYESLTCLVKVQDGGGQALIVLRKKGHEFTTRSQKMFERQDFHKAGSGVYQTSVFEARGVSLTDVHHFCQEACNQETCCDGFILNQNVLNGGTIMCGLLSYPDVFLCRDQDYDDAAAQTGGKRVCGAGVKYNKLRKQFTFSFGGQNFTLNDMALPATSKNKTDYQATLISFQRVYLWKDSDMNTRPKSAPGCASIVPPEGKILLSDTVQEAFTPVESSNVLVNPTQDIGHQQYWIFKHEFSAQQAQLWCLKRCEEEEFCKVTDLQDNDTLHFTCTLYPDTQICGSYNKPIQRSCTLVLPVEPQSVHRKKIELTGRVKNFYRRVPFTKLVAYSVRNRVNQTGKPVTNGFNECELRCDEDPCCKGFGFVRDSQSPGNEVLCLTLNSIGVQTCSDQEKTTWRVMDCSTSKAESNVLPFGFYKKPVNQWNHNPKACPAFHLPSPYQSQNAVLSAWEFLDFSSVAIDPSISEYDVIHLSKDITEDFNKSRDWCLSACTENASCATVTVDITDSAVRCVFYPDTHRCSPSTLGQECKLLLREQGLLVLHKKNFKPRLTSVFIPDHGMVLGESQLKLLGSDRKEVNHFLGVPYALPPTGNNRFRPPQPPQWTDTWNATYTRPSCLQPGDDQTLAADEDCLYLNIYVPRSIRDNSSVLIFFHNPVRDASNTGQDPLDGSYLAAVGDIIVVTVSFRVGAFGFLSAGSEAAPGNYGLQDQVLALRWIQSNIGHFGGDPGKVTLGAERSNADIASLLLTSAVAQGLFHRVLLLGGTAFSPASVINSFKAREKTTSLGTEVGCSSTDHDQLISCLRTVPALTLNAAQTKLLAVSGPFQAWAPVVDGISVQEPPSTAFHSSRFHNVDLMIGSSADDGLIGRAKRIKKFEVLQGRASSKTAFYEALSNSLGGDDSNSFVKDAATWFYSLLHDPSPVGYNVFSRALENATRDLFIICPIVKMASFWAANTRSNVFMYHVPEDITQTSTDFAVPMDVQLVFGLPHHPNTRQLFTEEERSLSLKIMHYVVNFIKSGNPNHPYSFSKLTLSETLPPWPRFLAHPEGDNYKEFATSLDNRKALRKMECSFWTDYIPTLTESTRQFSSGISNEEANTLAVPTVETKLIGLFGTTVTQSKPKSEKDTYN